MHFSLSTLLKLWNKWFTRSDEQTRLNETLEQLIPLIDPLLLHTSGYPTLYRGAIQQASQYVDQLTTQTPGPIQLVAKNFTSDPLIRALFPSPQLLEENLRLSIAMREYQPVQPGKQQLFAVMGVRWSRNLRYGIERSGEIIQSSVPQQTIDFKDHTFTLPASTEVEARQLLRDHFLSRLGNRVKEQIQSLKEQRDQLYLLGKRKENALRKSDQPAQPEKVEEIDRLWDSWRALNRQLDTDHAIDHFNSVMYSPSDHLQLEPYQLSIDPMGVERPPDEGGSTLNLMELHGGDQRIRTIMLVQFPWQRPPSTDDQIQQAYRWLAIS
ncbi:MAG: hypothetical protein HN842_08795 [Gammaproteobacteria bacterium]|nr:hypothetical protein [Gammaproteobacteria bacterium]